MKIRDSLKALMALRRVSKRDISEELDIPWNTLNRYLSGQNDISTEKFVRVLKFLGIDIVRLMNQTIKDLLNEESVNKKNLHDLHYVLGSLDEIDRKVHLEDLIVSANRKYKVRPEPQLHDAIKGLRELTQL